MPLPRRFKSLSTALLAVAVAAAGIEYWRVAIHPFETTDNTYLKAHMSLVSPKEMGYVTEVLFEDNVKVQTGDLLVAIDDRDFRARVAEAQARTEMETARIQTLETDKRAQLAKIRQEEAGIRAAEADLERSAKEFRRFRNLSASGAVSAQTRDNAEAVYKQALAQREKMRSAQGEAQSLLASLDARIGETEARLRAAQAALDLARIALANTRVTAPFSGVIGHRSVQVGQLVKPGDALAFLIPGEGLFVEANFKETQIARMRPGQPVEIRVDAFPDRAFEGWVDSFAPASGSEFSLLPPENATGNFTKIVRRVPVKILFKPGADLSGLRPGLSTAVKVRVG